MSDTTPPAAPEPTPPPSGTPAPGYSAQNPYAAPGEQPKTPVLSILSLVAGIVGFFGAWFGFVPIFGIIAWPIPIAAIVLGVVARRKEPEASKGLWLTGIILGAVSLAIALIGLIVWIVLIATAGTPGFWDSIDGFRY